MRDIRVRLSRPFVGQKARPSRGAVGEEPKAAMVAFARGVHSVTNRR